MNSEVLHEQATSHCKQQQLQKKNQNSDTKWNKVESNGNSHGKRIQGQTDRVRQDGEQTNENWENRQYQKTSTSDGQASRNEVKRTPNIITNIYKEL